MVGQVLRPYNPTNQLIYIVSRDVDGDPLFAVRIDTLGFCEAFPEVAALLPTHTYIHDGILGLLNRIIQIIISEFISFLSELPEFGHGHDFTLGLIISRLKSYSIILLPQRYP